MIRRRQFLVLLTSLIALLGVTRAARPADRKNATTPDRSRLLLHRGWLLRSDDIPHL